jgi:DNA-binding response OmpR family regulator
LASKVLLQVWNEYLQEISMILVGEAPAAMDVQNAMTGYALPTSPDGGDSENRITVLVVSPNEEDRRSLRAIFGHSNWSLFTTGTVAETLNFLKHHVIPVILCERDLPDGGWKQLLAALVGCDHAPHLVVAARLADERLWAEVLNLGGYDVLLKPFCSREVFRVLSMAWRDWSDRRRVARSW